ncbi:MAG: PIN domain-containing protein [Pseudonocardia sp.]|nr:PIN domain-containing protein [Pseudonocardia sp.]
MPGPVVYDTSVLINIDEVELGHHADSTVVVSAITVAELAYGLDIVSGAEAEARAQRFREVLDNYEILRFGVEEAKLYGAMATLVRIAGRDPRPRRLDLQIAATAAAVRFPLLTCNPKDFVGVERLVDVVALPRGA